MATRDGRSLLTLAEQANRIDPNGSQAKIAEILNETNEFFQDAIWMEANDTWHYTVTRRANLPAGSWRSLNDGVGKEASKSIKVHEGIAMLESYSEPDKAIIDSFPNPSQARMDEAASFIEGMGQTLVYNFVYGNAGTDPEKFTGLAPRLATLNTAGFVHGAGGTGSDVTSCYIVQWGEGKVFMTYPRGHKTLGINHDDLGVHTVSGITTSTQYQAYRDHFMIYCGLVVKDPRCIGRVANIESAGAANLFDEDLLIRILNKMPMRGRGAVIYCNDTVMSQVEIATKDKSNVNFTTREGIGGVEVNTFRGRAFRQLDQIVNTETAIS
jgi:hypothetical protein